MNVQRPISAKSSLPVPPDVQQRFAGYIRAVARGSNLGRTLTMAEAEDAMALILSGEAAPTQVGALLAVMRYRKESPEELAGFVRAARSSFVKAPQDAIARLDWPSYADKHKQLPYFILAALLLAENGVSVLMHGIDGDGPATTPKTLAALDIEASLSLAEAAERIARTGFAYTPLEAFCPGLAQLFGLRPILGVRSAANSFAREINPANARYQLQGVFHPTYLPTHLSTAKLLEQPHAAIFKGGAGEVQRNPEKACRVATLHDGVESEESWPATMPEARHPWREEPLHPVRVASLWRGEWEAPAPLAAILGTTAIALKLTGRAATIEAAEAEARRLWDARPRKKYGGA